jgi:hypothetical protein
MATSPRGATRRQIVKRGAHRAALSAASPPTSAHDQLVAVKASLEIISAKLNGVDPNTLSDADHQTWSDDIDKVDLAIARVRNSLLNGIVAEFEQAMPAIQASTAKAEADLAKLTRFVDIINAVAGALGVIEEIITLGK